MTLQIVADVMLRFRDTSFRWIDVKHFTFEGERSYSDLLSALIEHPWFRDGYIGGSVGEHPQHGPYRLEAIRPDSYERVDPRQALAVLDDFLSLYDCPPPASLAADVDRVVRSRIQSADRLFRLPALEDAQHDLGGILQEFRELVVVDSTACEVALVVMGVD